MVRNGIFCIVLIASFSCTRERAQNAVIRLGKPAVVADLAVSLKSTAWGSSGELALSTTDGRVAVVGADGAGPVWITDTSPKDSVSSKASGDDATVADASAKQPQKLLPIVADFDGTSLLLLRGTSISWWRVRPKVKLLGELVGPQRITAAVLQGDGKHALFGTEQGHLLQWTGASSKEARALPKLACSGMYVQSHHMRLPVKQRCPYGTYLPPATLGGKGICTYPVTHLRRHEAQIAIVCRTGDVTLWNTKSKKRRHFVAGALVDLAIVNADHIALLGHSGTIRVRDFSQNKTVTEFNVKDANQIAATDTALAVGSGKTLRIYSLSGKRIKQHVLNGKVFGLGATADRVFWVDQAGFLGDWKTTAAASQ